MKLYSTLRSEKSVETVIEQSKFIAHVSPANSREEAEKFIEKIRKEYRDATHNVPCFVLGDKMQIQWASDDGEPQGTSGAPMMQMLVSMGITNVVVCVTRYFGGIKLGTGGLVRAYTKSLKAAIDEAEVIDIKEQTITKIMLDYTYLSKIQCLNLECLKISNIEYGEKITLDLICDPEMSQNVMARVSDITAGKVQIISETIEAVGI